MPQIEFGLWLLVGGIDQAYETFNVMQEIAPPVPANGIYF